jgi:hypothetical protein
MTVSERYLSMFGSKKFSPLILVPILILVNFLIRILIWDNTELFRFSDYTAYMGGVDNLVQGNDQYILYGNYLFGISYLGFFAVKLLGSLDYFFVFNCFIASATSLILYFLMTRITGIPVAGVITVFIHTIYTEYMVFSSVFYSQILMIFLLSVFLLFISIYLKSEKFINSLLSVISLLFIFLMTFLIRPELKYLPWFLLVFSLFFIRTNRLFFYKIIKLSFLLLTTCFLLSISNIITRPANHVYSNSFVFFGHTDYGGDGGEGTFVYPENKVKYETALAEYVKTNNLVNLSVSDINKFQRKEIINFITQHPFGWIKVQLTKFFRTFGVVPETTSFKVLYTGLFRGNIWLTSIIVVAPVALIILMFILFFNFSALKQLFVHPVSSHLVPRTPHPSKHFLYVYLLLFIYYIIASIFFGQYQERYRIPLIVVFIIPALGFFIASFDKEQFCKKSSLLIKGAVIVLFLVIWTFQAEKAISNKERLNNAMESIRLVKPDA